ncbi:expressed unknown protein [Seminavis robusta]|uniref:Uncharacterized protein n=2 Tax=Seminavis robusta TaxID=568900 RepID=A0A9N8E413_9STRA|nr:expressed unknown protein [Seminavis robusta]|eukprot:Sro631_g178590.1 n/a (322) ;mRNA; f:52576-53541
MNNQGATADFGFAMKPPELSATSEETEASIQPPPGKPTTAPFEISQGKTMNQAWVDKMQQAATTKSPKRQIKIKAIGKKLGGALRAVNNNLNVAKWIDDLEQDQDLADKLDRINDETADEATRKEIVRAATEACLQTMRTHLLEFLDERPQATYEEWICELHPENKNMKMDGLTQIPLIDHRFYVQDSDHRILWNEYLNDLSNPKNLTPVRHFVAARTMLKQPSNLSTTASSNSNTNSGNTAPLISLGEHHQDPFATTLDTTKAVAPSDPFAQETTTQQQEQTIQTDLLGINNNGSNLPESNPQQQQPDNKEEGVVDLLSM